MSYSVLSEGESLVHGNELLNQLDPTYPLTKNYRALQHTLLAVRSVLQNQNVAPPDSMMPSSFGAFVGYLLLDALIGNTDRHHENWGVIVATGGGSRRLTLAPSYDHASSLRRELSDEARRQRLETKDPRANVAAYAARARSALYRPGEKKPLTCIEAFEAFEAACHLDQVASSSWRARLGQVRAEQLDEIVRRVPSQLMSPTAADFAVALLKHNLHELQHR